MALSVQSKLRLQRTGRNVEQLSLFSLRPKVERAVETFKMFEEMALRLHPEGYYLAFSGGKDSQAVYHLAQIAGVRFHAHYHVTTVDPPELVRFIKRQYPNAVMETPRQNMWELIIKKQFPPTRRIRYCCSELKEYGGKGRFVVTGVRWEESTRRKTWSRALVKSAKKEQDIILLNDNNEKRRGVEHCVMKGKYILNPVLDWTQEDVWAFLHQIDAGHCELYDCGFSRIGCIGCPMASIRKREFELERYPGYKRAYLRAFGRMLAAREKERETQWKDAGEVYDWWLYGNGKQKPQVPGQLSISDLAS